MILPVNEWSHTAVGVDGTNEMHFVNGAFAGKRKIGRPLKYNIRHKGAQGWIELVFNPRTRFEQYVSEAMRFIHPYLFFVTYRFHVEKAREAGKYK